MRFGVDTGGTFTDVICLTEAGVLATYKLLSTPDDPSKAIVEGMRNLDATSFQLVHGTTVATNALLERRGARLAFITTRGFEDLLFLRRQNRPELYTFNVKRRPALVAAEDCVGVQERMLSDGTVHGELADSEVARVVNEVAARGVDAVAICLLHAYANHEHEARIAEALRSELDVFITASHEVLPQFREYERASTTAVNAFIGPVMSRYLGELTRALPEARSVDILQSNGGRASVDYVRHYPVHTVLSGPAGGVVGAWSVARELGIDKIITLDMGGTSTDVSLARGGLTWTSEAEIDGLPVHVPVTDIETVGAGGGSIAYIDPGGSLRVGPQSAGADPGPASYGLGGGSFTVTDAHLILGRLRAEAFLSGEMQLDRVAAVQAAETLAASLGEDVVDLANAVLEIANVAMVRAIKTVSVERGHDPSEFSMVAFGGAGGLHACGIADALDIQRVIVPRVPGLLSAYGMLRADTLRVVSATLLAELQTVLGTERLRRSLEELSAELDRSLEGSYDVEVEADLRYVGQSFEISVPVHWSVELFDDDPTTQFERQHENLFGYLTERPIELVGIRLIGRAAAAEWQSSEVPSGDGLYRTEVVVFGEAAHETRIFERSELPDDVLEGPVIVSEYSATTIVPPGWRLSLSKGHLMLEKSA